MAGRKQSVGAGKRVAFGKRRSRTSHGPGRRLHGELLRHLGIAIVSGKYAPGSILADEIAFSKTLQVSRGAYREALQALTAKGLVERRQKAGTRILPRSRWSLLDPEVLAWFFQGKPDLGFIRDLFELRAILEPAAARLAATRRDASQLGELSESLAAMRHHTLATEAGRLADRDFHQTLLAATHNETVVALASSIAAAVRWTTEFKQRTRALPRDPIPDHERVLRAIAARDAEAAGEAMARLVDLALADTRGSMAPRRSAKAPNVPSRAGDRAARLWAANPRTRKK